LRDEKSKRAKVHVHVYQLAALAEDTVMVEDSRSADDAEIRAKDHALKKAKAGELEFREPDNEFIALSWVEGVEE